MANCHDGSHNTGTHPEYHIQTGMIFLLDWILIPIFVIDDRSVNHNPYQTENHVMRMYMTIYNVKDDDGIDAVICIKSEGLDAVDKSLADIASAHSDATFRGTYRLVEIDG